MFSTKDRTSYVQTVAPAEHASDVTGTAVDTANFGSATLVIVAGEITDATHTPVLQESATTTGGDFTNVAAADLDGTLVAITDASVQKVGYLGTKRYLRLFVDVVGATDGGIYTAFVALGSPHKSPV